MSIESLLLDAGLPVDMTMREACAIVQAYADLHTEGECIEACALMEDEGTAEQKAAAELFMSVYP